MRLDRIAGCVVAAAQARQGPWTQRAPGESNVTWWIGLEASRPQALAEAFANITTPTHAQFMRYLDKDAADKLTRPDSSALPTLTQWLASASFNWTYSPASNVLIVKSTVAQLQQLVGIKLDATSKLSLPIPPALKTYIQFIRAALPVSPRDAPSNPQPALRRLTTSTSISPATLRALYGIPDNLVVRDARATQSIAIFYEASYSDADLEVFHREMHSLASFRPVAARGTNDPKHPHGEPSLDLQYMTGVALNATTTAWSVPGRNPFSALDEPFVAWAADVLAQAAPPLVHSLSYADDEAHLAATAPAYLATMDRLLMKMAVRGLTVVVASGDDGVMGLRHRQSNVSLADACARSGPQWPSSSPYVTSVGATQLDSGDEVVCSAARDGRITSGGGFSAVYDRPAYQRVAVAAYVTALRLPSAFANVSGRAYPDVAAVGSRYRVRVNGRWRSISGTSASAPVVAAMATLWNDARLRAGKRPVGFLNPLLYQFQTLGAFFDVTVGDNRAGKRQDGEVPKCADGFAAAAGWDAASGLGAPRFDVLAALFLHAEDVVRGAFVVPEVVQVPAARAAVLAVSAPVAHGKSALVGAGIFLGTLVAAVAMAVGAMRLGVFLARRWRSAYELVPPIDLL
ncbi:tripeptidyl-peptidase [Achlya hypogyna]|uniref:subtilisin n=1 Tax=Achlya hypogyna TaxID=1202772 RepID=A0A1V9YGL3_ACHHY|nr:tripeptidyl-peptidase [Achlya hypogyna]